MEKNKIFRFFCFFFKRIGPKLLDKEGKEAPGSKGYK